MTVAKRPSTREVCLGSGRDPKMFKFNVAKGWTYVEAEERPEHVEVATCPVCTRVFNVTARGLVPRHLTR
jgi:hypothetical protein